MIASVDRFVSADLPASQVHRPVTDAAASPCLRNAVLASAVLWALIGALLAFLL